MKNISASILLVVPIFLGFVEKSLGEKASQLDQLQAAFVQQVSAIDNDSNSQRMKLMVDYRKALQKLRDSYRKSGDLDNVMIVQEEEKRFTKSGTVSGDVLVQEPDKLLALQSQYLKTRDKIKLTAAQRTIDLAKKYRMKLVPAGS